MKITKKGNTLASIKKPLTELTATLFMGLVIFNRKKIYIWLGITDNQLITYQGYDNLLSLIFLAVLLFLFWKSVIGISMVLSTISDEKEKQKMKMSRSNLKGKQYTLDEILKMLRESDIIEIDIKTSTDVITIGASSDCEHDGWKFFDKSYYIEDKEYGLEQEKQLLDDIRYMCGGESITVLKIDGIKVK